MEAMQFFTRILNASGGEGWKTRTLQIAVLIVTVAISVFIIINQDVIREEYQNFQNYGYLGAFIIGLITSASLVLPVPGWFLIAAIGVVLNPYLVGLAAAFGSTIGEMTGYGLGFGGRIAVEKVPKYDTVVGWMRRWGSPTIFILSLIPNPIFDIAGIAAGALKFPLWKFLLWGLLGRIPKCIFYAFTGIWFSWMFQIGL
jgi:uncharacterized membrane protein YdjX (TVP38/TMEM64 family)